MELQKAVASVESLYAHAIAMEREAAARYREFAQSMRDHGNDETAQLFERLAKLESAHADRLERDTRKLSVPALKREEFAWLDVGPEVAGSHEFVMRLMSPHDALKIALAGEERARDFFANALEVARSGDVKALALEMMKDEADHIEWVREALSHEPGPVNWEKLFLNRDMSLVPGDPDVVALEEMSPRARKTALKVGGARRKPAAKARAAKPAKRAGAKRAAAPAKKAAVKARAKRPAAKKAAAKRPATKKKAAARKPVAGKPAAKRAATKKAVKKRAARKGAAGKPLAEELRERITAAARRLTSGKPAKKAKAKK
jgi:rubrerythrin